MQNTEIRTAQSPSPGKFVFVRARTVREIMRDTTTILRTHFNAIFDPFLISAGIGGVLMWASVRSGNHVLTVCAAMLSGLLVTFASAAAIMQVGELAAGRRPDLANALKAVTTTYFPRLLGSTLLAWGAIGAGSMFIIPAIVLWLSLMYTQHFVMLEHLGIRDSLEGSVAIARSSWRRGLALAAWVSAPQLFVVLCTILLMKNGIVPQGTMANLLYSLWGALLFLALPVFAVATTLLYIDLRLPDIERQERELNADH